MSSKKIATNVQKAAIVESNAVEAPAPIETSKDFVTIASHMPQGIIFTDIPSKDGGTKTVEIPGCNSNIKQTGGILLGVGQSVAIQLPKEDWENIKRLHGRERAFQSYNGFPPCLMEITDPKSIHSNADVKSQRHGLEPIDPKEVQVVEAELPPLRRQRWQFMISAQASCCHCSSTSKMRPNIPTN